MNGWEIVMMRAASGTNVRELIESVINILFCLTTDLTIHSARNVTSGIINCYYSVPRLASAVPNNNS